MTATVGLFNGAARPNWSGGGRVAPHAFFGGAHRPASAMFGGTHLSAATFFGGQHRAVFGGVGGIVDQYG